jgi:hypothetical protein
MTTEVTQHRETAFGQTTKRQRSKLLEATIDTDSSGNGSVTVEFSEYFQDDTDELRRPFASTPWVFIEQSSDPAAEIQNLTADSMDIAVSGSSTTSGTVTVRALAIGEWGQRA